MTMHDGSALPGRTEDGEQPHFKDAVLDRIASIGNVAQFVSFDPGLRQRYCRIRGHSPNIEFANPEAAIAALFTASFEGSVNVRSFTPDNPKSRQFIYGLESAAEAATQMRLLASQGLFTIVNETIDVTDGGVSGVAFGDLIEFAPGDTPRCVEKAGTAAFPRAVGLHVLEMVYGFRVALDFEAHQRVEFSLHPLQRGVRREHLIVWEVEAFGSVPPKPSIRWPNKFSRLLGDKAFGLLVGDALGVPVPATTVLCRAVAPFRFGMPTGTGEIWFRTCPIEQVPGKFTTKHGWLDPFRLMAREDPDADMLASALAQEGVDARYSGALLTSADGQVMVEGVLGGGEDFMQGSAGPINLPSAVEDSIRALCARLETQLGPVRFEWVHDGQRPWVVQLHCGPSPTMGDVIFPGTAREFIPFDVTDGLEKLRELVNRVRGTDLGVLLVGQVGVSSHMGDVLRRAQIPSRRSPL